jgi:hypothetical protein
MLPAWPGRIASATPEILASLSYFTAWFAPASLSGEFLRGLVAAMLVEFLVVHSSAFLSAFVDRGKGGRAGPFLVALALAAFYMIFAGAFALAFHSWMPVWIMGWLLGSRLLTLLVDYRGRGDESARQRVLWISGALLYLVLAFATTIPPIPAFGIDEAVRARMALPGSGLWIDQPQRPIAMGAFYFGLLAVIELTDWGVPPPRFRPPQPPV